MGTKQEIEIKACQGLGLQYPCLPELDGITAQMNHAIRRTAEEQQSRMRALLAKERTRQSARSGDGFSAEFSCQVMRRDSWYLSYFCDAYLQRGREAPLLHRYSETYDVRTARRLTLPDFFLPGGRWKTELMERLQRQRYADRQPAYTYFTSQRIRLDPNWFYLNEDGLVLWQPAGEIAPQNTGIPSFLLEPAGLVQILRLPL